ncbi:MAG: phosphoribulokinase [Methanoregulaceae archaeon PtaB.Bin108]|nr:MAG: phosphoribulokinase [Methanoregulaceae archaeon PtaB.Bin108]OPY41541.1 MAG: phosphoribulokinase [Methanoregulaceae archaeon PtaU1.Bin222]
MSNDRDFRKFLSESKRVYIIGVAGDSGSGKSTFTAGLRNMLGEDLVSTISLDDYHRYDREQRNSLQITPLNPAANDIARLERDVRMLKQGGSIEKMRYNHGTGTIEGPVSFSPAKVIILEGLHPLSTPGLRDLLDFSFFVDPSPDVKREWKLKRDMGSRGYTEQEVRREMAIREPDYLAFVAPQREHAQAIIGISFSRFGRKLGWNENIYRVSLTIAPLPEMHEKVWMNFDIGSVISGHRRPYSVEYMPVGNAGHHMGRIELDGGFPCDAAKELFSRLREQTGIDPSSLIPTCPLLTPTDIMQMIVCWRIISHRLMLD